MTVKSLDDDSECSVKFTATHSINRKSLYQHYLDLFWIEWRSTLVVLIASWGSLWGLLGIVNQIYPQFDFTSSEGAIVSFYLSLFISLASSVFNYTNVVPSGFQQEAKNVARLAHIQPAMWESKLGAELLSIYVLSLQKDLGRLLEGKKYVTICQSIGGGKEYREWMKCRFESIRRMLNSYQSLVMGEMLEKIYPESRGDALEILLVVREVRIFVKQIIEFEEDVFRVLPPEGLEKLHKYKSGWTLPIYNSLVEISDFIRKTSLLSVKELQTCDAPLFVLNQPENMKKWNEEMDRINGEIS